ncbi:MAG: AAA family ATPase [Candidatus Kapabacteria bacterium]|nr:AAA family ATPase [Candidatus Kapabacteria bacterium]MDW8012057.1 AAA family ATPase [Bacteroidota bacterium]
MKRFGAKLPEPLPPEKLRWRCSEEELPFETTDELEPLQEIVGQSRALEALRLGVSLWAPGYNIYVSGLSGTGRLATVQKILQEALTVCPPLYDYCYVHNFRDRSQPRLLRLPKGQGTAFRNALERAIALLRQRIPQLFEQEEFRSRRHSLAQDFEQRHRQLLQQFEERLRQQGFALGQVETQAGVEPEIFPVVAGTPITIGELDDYVRGRKLTPEEAQEIRRRYDEARFGLQELTRAAARLWQEYQQAVREHDRSAVMVLVRGIFGELRENFPYERVEEFLAEVEQDLLDHLHLFVAEPQETPLQAEQRLALLNERLRYYSVNVVVDNSQTECAPVIVETSPTYANLFGTIDRAVDGRGLWSADYTSIRAGSVLRADQGYLILNALDVLIQPGVWAALKNVILYGKLDIQAWDPLFALLPTGIKPEPVHVRLKVVLIGPEEVYTLLHLLDEDFPKMFKVHAQFDSEAPRSPELLLAYARFIRKLSQQEGILPAHRSAVAAIAEWAAEWAETQRKLTLLFSDLADVVREAHHVAQQQGAARIERVHVEEALSARRRRSDLVDEKIRELILQGSLLIDTTGERIGQVNGLTVYSTGTYNFGKPVRITASVGSGSSGIISIEREAELSGRIHSKGVLILAGLLRERFAHRHPLTLTASLTFEQSYSSVDGDSASAAELYALLSALAQVPVRQEIAVTGSLSQKGDIQPVGGINEKIRGFFEICQARGLTGTQGVIIPRQNVEDLMLPDIIIDAVREGRFHIWPIRHFEEGIPLLMGMPAGVLRPDGTYPRNTLFGKVQKRLEELWRLSQSDRQPSSNRLRRAHRNRVTLKR